MSASGSTLAPPAERRQTGHRGHGVQGDAATDPAAQGARVRAGPGGAEQRGQTPSAATTRSAVHSRRCDRSAARIRTRPTPRVSAARRRRRSRSGRARCRGPTAPMSTNHHEVCGAQAWGASQPMMLSTRGQRDQPAQPGDAEQGCRHQELDHPGAARDRLDRALARRRDRRVIQGAGPCPAAGAGGRGRRRIRRGSARAARTPVARRSGWSRRARRSRCPVRGARPACAPTPRRAARRWSRPVGRGDGERVARGSGQGSASRSTLPEVRVGRSGTSTSSGTRAAGRRSVRKPRASSARKPFPFRYQVARPGSAPRPGCRAPRRPRRVRLAALSTWRRSRRVRCAARPP